jgi:hypothetical protein
VLHVWWCHQCHQQQHTFAFCLCGFGAERRLLQALYDHRIAGYCAGACVPDLLLCLRFLVLLLQYNMKVRLGRGFTLAELKVSRACVISFQCDLYQRVSHCCALPSAIIAETTLTCKILSQFVRRPVMAAVAMAALGAAAMVLATVAAIAAATMAATAGDACGGGGGDGDGGALAMAMCWQWWRRRLCASAGGWHPQEGGAHHWHRRRPQAHQPLRK